MSQLCPLCERVLGTVNIDRHHLVPKSRKGREQFPIHKVCHRKIHATFTEKELERTYNTWEALRADPMIQEFVVWVQKKPIDFYASTQTSKRRK